MKRLFLISIVGLFSFLLQSCFEDITVVKVKKDGSGTIHKSTYSNTAAAGALGGFGGEGGAPEKEPAPTEEELKEIAEEFGEGVTFKSIKEGKNKAGWEGFESIFTFKDVTKLKINTDSSLDAGALAGEEPEADAEYVTFSKKGNTLTINVPFSPLDEEMQEEEQSDEEIEQMIAMMGPMFKGARMVFQVEVEDGIAKTNAKYQEENVITVMEADFGAVFSNAESVKKMGKMEAVKTREEAAKFVDEVDGFSYDLQEKIHVKIK